MTVCRNEKCGRYIGIMRGIRMRSVNNICVKYEGCVRGVSLVTYQYVNNV